MYCISGRMWETCGIWPMLRSCGDGSVVRVENLPRCLTSCTLKTSSVGTIPHIFQGGTFGRGDFKTDTAVQSQAHSGQMFGNFVPWRHRIQEVFLLTKGLVSTICIQPKMWSTYSMRAEHGPKAAPKLSGRGADRSLVCHLTDQQFSHIYTYRYFRVTNLWGNPHRHGGNILTEYC